MPFSSLFIDEWAGNITPRSVKSKMSLCFVQPESKLLSKYCMVSTGVSEEGIKTFHQRKMML